MDQNDEELKDEFSCGFSCGLINLGNTCYFNAVIQCLSYTDPLRQYLLSNHLNNDLKTFSEDPKQGVTAFLLALLFRQMVSNKYQSLKPTKLLSTITSLSDNFSVGEQHDSHEVLTFLLNRLHLDLNQIKSISHKTVDKDLEECSELEAKQYWNSFKRQNDSIIIDLFFFQTLSESSYKFGEDCYISVPIIEEKRRINLKDCLKQYFSDEYLRDGNEWFCPKCKHKRNARKKYSLWSLPLIAIIQLKRFGFTDNYCLRKIMTEVDFPLNNLDLSEYSYNQKTNQKSKYCLYAVVNHLGSLSSGHYITFAKTQNSVWRRFDDNYVEDMNESEVRTKSAYILFYKRTDL